MTDATLMQKLFGLAGALVASFTLSFAISPAFADPSIGKMAPDFIGVASDGKSYRLKEAEEREAERKSKRKKRGSKKKRGEKE